MLFEFRHVSKKKPVETQKSSTELGYILHDLHFNINARIPQLVLGPSGSGKSTLLRMCNRLTDPDSGDILFHSKNICLYDVIELRTRIGYVAQVPVMLDGSVLSNFKYAVRKQNKTRPDSKEFEEECRIILRFLNLPEPFLFYETDRLSVGEKQRVALARTLLRKPEVVLLDEPTSALDRTSTLRFLDTINKLRDETELTIIMVTHSIEQAKILGGNAIVLLAGNIVEQGPVSEIMNNPQTETTKQFIEGTLDN